MSNEKDLVFKKSRSKTSKHYHYKTHATSWKPPEILKTNQQNDTHDDKSDTTKRRNLKRGKAPDLLSSNEPTSIIAHHSRKKSTAPTKPNTQAQCNEPLPAVADQSRKKTASSIQINDRSRPKISFSLNIDLDKYKNLNPRNDTLGQAKRKNQSSNIEVKKKSNILNIHQKKVIEKMQIKKAVKAAANYISSMPKKKMPGENTAERRLSDIRDRQSEELNPGKRTASKSLEEPFIAKKRLKCASDDSFYNSENINDSKRNSVHFKNTIRKSESYRRPNQKSFILNDSKSKSLSTNDSICTEEPMDCENVVDMVLQARTSFKTPIIEEVMETFVNQNSNTNKSFSKNVHIVVDTNIFISHISIVDRLINTLTENYNHLVVVPWRVFCELDSFKKSFTDNQSAQSINHLARRAMNFLNKNLPTNDRLIGQSLKEASNHLYPCDAPDDEILNCCLQFLNSGSNVILLSNDRNLCNKALVNNIQAYGHEEFWNNFQKKNENQTITSIKNVPDVSSFSNVNEKKIVDKSNDNLTLFEAYEKIQEALTEFLSVVLETEMKLRYEELWLQIILIKPPWTLASILKCVSKHWIAVFSEILPNDATFFVKELQYFYPARRKVNISIMEDINTIGNAGIHLAEILKKHTKYKTIGDKCIKSIQEVLGSKNEKQSNTLNAIENEDVEIKILETENNNGLTIENEHTYLNENIISNTLVAIWNGLSVYCSKLANGLNVPHFLNEDINSMSSLEELLPQADSVLNQVKLIINVLSRVLVIFPVETTSPDYKLMEANKASEEFYQILYDTMIGMGHSGLNFDKDLLVAYCSLHRDVLEDGWTKFSMLQKLLIDCSSKMFNISNFST